ncbi:MAG: ExeM/NucH family extracellular endonuclease [Thermoanaerobaculia bacterium]|nr:ExeM/NucH family extracellular endonuclease [Thermoanaerobaculia bacterium]
MNASRRVSLLFVSFLVVLFGAQRAAGQCVSLTTLGSPSTQNFTALANAGTNVAWTDNSTIAGWYATRTTYNAGTGSSNTGAMYSFGVAGTNPLTDRALGGVASGGTGTFYWAGCFTNNTGSALTSVDIAYIGEQWRDGGATVPVAHSMAFEFQTAAAGTITDADTPTTGWTAVAALDFASPTFTNTGAGVLLDGNAAANRTAKAATITVAVPIGNQFWVRWRDINDGGNDHGLAVDDFSITPQGGGNAPVVPTCPASLTTTSGTATSGGVSATDTDGTVITTTITSITPSDPGTITLTGFTPAGGVGGTANATLSVSAATPANTYSVTIQWANNDGVPQTANCVVSVVVNAPPSVVFIHDVQGPGAATPIPGASVTVEGVVIGDFQPLPNDTRLSGFFLQEEDADADADPATSEGIFVFCSACPTDVAEGQRVQVTGTVSEFFNLTEITATTPVSVVITNAGNNLAQVTPATIDLPIPTPTIDDFYEPRESMLVTYVDTLTVSEYFEQTRYGRIELFEGGRPRQYTEVNPPNAAGYAAQLDNLSRRRVYVDDDDNVEYSPLLLPDGSEFVFHPRANGGLSIGTQGTDFFRGGDLINGLTGILHYSFSGGTSPNEWRVRPIAATPAGFTVANPRPATPPAVGGAIRVASANVLNYFTTLNVRGADSVAELNRQRERTSIVICSLDADVAALMEIENGNTAIADLLADVNIRCGGANPYTFVNTGGALGTDQIRVMLIYRTGIVSPVGAPIVDLDLVHNRPPTAQTFDVVDATNPAFGERFTAIANHSKSKSCGGASGADLDQNDGQGCFAATRVAQHNLLITWVNGTVIPAAGDPDVLLLGDFNSYAQETPTTTLTGAGFTDLETAFLGANTYSYLFDGQLGHLDYAFSSASLTPQVTGVNVWHINADENPLFDYNDEIDDGAAEAFLEEKPDGSALVPPRVLFQPASPFRASDHDPVILGIFQIADLVVTKTDSPDPVSAGNNLTYTITVTNNGPDAASSASWSDALPAGTTFVSLTNVAGWSCTTPAVGANGTVSCTNPSFGVGSAIFTQTVNVQASIAAGTVLTNNATASSASAEGNSGDETGTATTTVAASADLSVTKTDSPDPVTAGNNLTYTITVTNAGPSDAAGVSFSDTLPAGTTFVSLSSPGGWSCTTPAVGAGGTVSCSNLSLAVGNAVFTLTVAVMPSTATGTVLSNTATVSSATSDPNTGNESDTETTTVAASADLSVTKVDTPDPVTAGNNLTYTITLTNAGPSDAAGVSLSDILPAATTFVSLSSPGGWSCTTPAVGASGGTVSCSNASLAAGSAVFTLTVGVPPSVPDGTVITNTATASSSTSDPNPGNESGTATTTVGVGSADLSVTKVDTPDPVTAGTNLTYTITVNNAGPSDATTATLSDTIPAGTSFASLSSPGGWSCTTPAVGASGTVSCSNPSLAPGNAVFTLTVGVPPSVPDGTVITNTATASSSTSDPNPGNESGTATTTVGVGSADLSVTKVDTPDPVNAGSNLTYTITVTNAGPSDATTATLSDTIPSGTTFVSLPSPAGWSCVVPAVGAGGPVTCSNPSMAIGSSVFTLTVAVDPLAAAGSIITNTAAIASATTDPDSSNDSSTATTDVVSPATISGTKTASGTFLPGSTVTYTIVLSNAGPATQLDNPGDELSDVLPPELTLLTATATSGTAIATIGTNTVAWNGSIPAAGSVTITIQALIEAVPVGTTISNQGTINYDADGNGTNETATLTDDPAQGGTNDPTVFTVPAVAAIPALDGFGHAGLAALIAGIGLLVMRRS